MTHTGVHALLASQMVYDYDFIVEYTTECTVGHSVESAGMSGNCDVDVNECASSPCWNGAICSDSGTDGLEDEYFDNSSWSGEEYGDSLLVNCCWPSAAKHGG